MIHFTVNDMTCGHCVGRVTEAIKSIDAAAQVSVDLVTHDVAIDSGVAPEKLLVAIKDAGFTPTPA